MKSLPNKSVYLYIFPNYNTLITNNLLIIKVRLVIYYKIFISSNTKNTHLVKIRIHDLIKSSKCNSRGICSSKITSMFLYYRLF